MHFPPASLNNNYAGSCTASGNPVPLVNVVLDQSEHCHYTTSAVITDRYTRKLTINIQLVTTECKGAVVRCQANGAKKIMRLNITGETITPNTIHLVSKLCGVCRFLFVHSVAKKGGCLRPKS